MTEDALVFDVQGIRFGIRAKQVKQVLQAVAISKLGGPKLVEGIINLRGHVVAVLDFRSIFQLPAKELEVSDHIIIMEAAAQDIAIRVDCAVDFIALDTAACEETKLNVAGEEFSRTIGKTAVGLVHMLTTDLLLSPGDAAMLGDWLADQSGDEDQ